MKEDKQPVLIDGERALEILKQAVTRLGSQAALAKAVGMDYQYLNMIMVGRRPLRHKKLLAFLGLKRANTFWLTNSRA